MSIKKSIVSSFVSDTYALGAHWVYDETELKNLNVNWETLNPPRSLWHGGKERGDFTHYGDQTLFLLEFISQNESFNKEEYYNFWKAKMSTYKGYMDGSSCAALNGMGVSSNDLSICGRIAPLLLCSSSKEEFLENVAAFTSITHNSTLALNASAFFAELLWLSQESNDIPFLIKTIRPNYPMFEKWIEEAIEKKECDSFETIREFGPACGIDGGFAGTIYLLLQNKSFKEIMMCNAKAGGDSSARGMTVAMILGMNVETELPSEWVKEMKNFNKVNNLLKKILISTKKPLDTLQLFNEVLGERVKEFKLPPPSFEVMQCEIIEFDEVEKSMLVKVPVLETWLNPYSTMQGGIIMGVMDNAVGPLSMLVAPKNITRNIESKLIKPITQELKYIYVSAVLFEAKKKRLIFDVLIRDKDENIYAKAKFTNWIID